MNMSYCRFENTSKALFDCEDALENADQDMTQLSDYEKRAVKSLYEACKRIAEQYTDDDIEQLTK